jgi:hypothetical protein
MQVPKRTVLPMLSTVLLLSGLPQPARAQRRSGPCSEDIHKFCAGVQQGSGRYRACLKQHEAELSSACQEHLKSAQARAAAWRQACEGDVQKLCSAVDAGGGRIMKCLREHEGEVSSACKEQLSKGGRRNRGGAPSASQ